MPNYINNRLWLEGPVGEIARLKALVVGHDARDELTILFDKLLPMPADLADEDSLDWQYENWGCKWGAEGLYDQSDKDTIDLFFSTPNDGAHGVMAALATQFPDLKGWYACGESANDWCSMSLINQGSPYTQGEDHSLDAEMAQTLDIPWDDEEEDEEEGEE